MLTIEFCHVAAMLFHENPNMCIQGQQRNSSTEYCTIWHLNLQTTRQNIRFYLDIRHWQLIAKHSFY